MRTLLRLLVLLFFPLSLTYSQCDVLASLTITICDMETIDGDGDSFPDGIINLFDEYTSATTLTLDAGHWVDPNVNFVLNSITGDVNLWGLNNASENSDDYSYQYYKDGCANPILTINVVLGSFSGKALPPVGLNSVNAQVCNTGSPCVVIESYDLFEALQTTPSPHLNGVWIYEGTSPNFRSITGSKLLVEIPYQAGQTLIEETFELTYVVPGIGICDAEKRTSVNISVVRRPSSGQSSVIKICEKELQAGLHDADIVLSNDVYLQGEDVEGTWSGGLNTENQISSLTDNTINIKELYANLVTVNPRFGYEIFNFKYTVNRRSGVCFDSESEIPFIIYEALRPFSQPSPENICLDGSEPTTINLMDGIEFTEENGVLFDYQPGTKASWSFVSGPGLEGLDYTTSGIVDLDKAISGTYLFRYTVSADINCGASCPTIGYKSNECPMDNGGPSFCSSETAVARLVITEPLYAGENTTDIEICRGANPVDLIALLETNDVEVVYRGANGVWTDSSNIIVPNDYSPEVSGQQIFNLTYTTTVNGNCSDSATLRFILFEEYKAGMGTSLVLCSDTSSFNLFDELTGDKSENGTWSGPNGFVATHLGQFDPSMQKSGVYTYSVPENGPCLASESIIEVTVEEKPNAGEDFTIALCKSDGITDLFSLLASDVHTDGVFTVVSSNTAVPSGILNLLSFDVDNFELVYSINRNNSCSEDSAVIFIQTIDVAPPVVENQSFCILEGATLGDVIVDVGAFNWYESETAESNLDLDTILENGSYFITNVGREDCESVRVEVTIKVFNIGETKDCKPELPEGISPNNDGKNDTFDMSNLEKSFPNFELSIYNRYGAKVYKGTIGTPYFSGLSNVSPSLGDNLSSGVYFYVFEPNDSVNSPFQDSFYLSK
ncbi:MAG: gliding motility-associated C-terminal domain-containing protein [Cellulophaga sp.]